MARSPFSPADLDRIARAVSGAEGSTSGEIVPYFVQRSDEYDEAVWRGGALGMGLALLGFYLYFEFSKAWLPFGLSGVAVLTLVIGGLGVALAVFVAPIRRLLAGRQLMERRVHARAMEAFVQQEVFKTRDRTGVLIFISNFEHQVVVIGDTGINARVEKGDWQAVVKLVTDGIRRKQAADGLLAAVQKCGELLHKQGVARRADDSNELADRLVIGD
jgi:putative membrane protein